MLCRKPLLPDQQFEKQEAHCLQGWSIDEAFSSRDSHNITLQRTMISEPLNVAGHQNYPNGTAHGYSATIGGSIGSYHHNLLAHAEGRSWSMGGGLTDAGVFGGEMEIRNNVVYNFGMILQSFYWQG